MRTAVLLLVTLSLACASVVVPEARAEDAEPVTTAPIVAVGEGGTTPFESAADATGFVEIIDAGDAWRGSTTVGELLERAAGVHVKHLGGREDFSTATVRGAGGGQVKILLDGVSLTSASTGIVDLADLPVDSIERIEVFRGFVPVSFGSAGASSVINVVTRRPKGRELSGSLSYGSFSSVKTFASAAYGAEDKLYSAALTHRYTKGDFEFEDRGDRGDPTDDRERTRINNDSESVDALLRHVRDLGPGTRLTLTQSTYYKDEGAPGRGSVQASNARFERLRSISSLTLEDRDHLRSEIAVTVTDESLRDPKSIGPGGVIDSLGLTYERSDGTAVSVDGRVSRPLYTGRFHILEASVDASYEYYRQSFPSSALSLPKRNQDRYRVSVAVGDEIVLFGGRLSLSPQLRHEQIWNDFDLDDVIPPLPAGSDSNDSDHSTDPRLGARYDVGYGLSLKGNVGTFFRPPTFQELFGSDGFSIGNPALDAEEGTNRDIGFIWSRARLGLLSDVALEYSFFRNDVDDVIVLLPSGARIPRPQNVGESRVTGNEVRVLGTAPKGFRLDATYTHQNAENRSDIVDEKGKDLPSLPDDELHVRLAWQRPAWSIAYDLSYRSEVYLDRFQSAVARVPGYTTHDVSLDFAFRPSGFHARIEASNLTDEQHEDVLGFPVPGRAFYVTLSYARAPQ